MSASMLKVDLVTRVLVPVPGAGLIEMSVEDATELRDALSASLAPMMPPIEDIKKLVGDEFRVFVSDMDSNSHEARVTFPRHVAMFIVRHVTRLSLQAIALAFSRTNHGAVIHGCRSVEARMQTEPKIREQVTALLKQCERLVK